MGEEGGVKWNMDEARLKSLQKYLDLAEKGLLEWDNEEIYVNLQMVHNILFGAFKDTENSDLNGDFKKIEEIKRSPAIQNDLHANFKIKQVELYNELKLLYRKLNKLQVKHGLYFRKKGDPNKAIQM